MTQPRLEVTLQVLPMFEETMIRSMAEAQPELLLNLYRSGRLAQHLQEAESRLMRLALDAKRRGLTDLQAEEVASVRVFPSQEPEFDPDQVKSEVPDETLKEILKSLQG